MRIEEIKAGESWACKFKTTTFLDQSGNPIQADLAIGEAHPGKPGNYESFGVIEVRDLEKCIVQIYDVKSQQRFTVNFSNCWDIDRVVWKNE